MANQDVFDGTVFTTGCFSTDVTLTDTGAVVNSVDDTCNVTLEGVVENPGDTASATWSDDTGDLFTMELAAQFDFDGGIVFRTAPATSSCSPRRRSPPEPQLRRGDRLRP